MSVRAVVGINWGDEGKGRMIDYFAEKADVVVRYQGGNNAGHTVVNDQGTFKLHLIPSGIFSRRAWNILGPGVVLNPEALAAEMAELTGRGIDLSRFKISDRASVVFPFHKNVDGWEEERLGRGAYGSTRQGIAPAYGDRLMKKTLLVGELFDDASLTERLGRVVDWQNAIATQMYGKPAVTLAEVTAWVKQWREPLRPHVADTTTLLHAAAAEGKDILFEAQLGALRDVQFGIYPYTTSSCTLAAFAPVGGGLFGHPLTEVVGVMKAFSTCVGAGPFVTEMPEAEATPFREKTGEFGATTGRPRRIGHFDAVASRYGCQIQGATTVALTKIDNLSGEKELRLCTHYLVNGVKTTAFPMGAALENATPVYEVMPGWSDDITGCRRVDDLPKAAQAYIDRIEELTGCPIGFVSVGPERHSLMTRQSRLGKGRKAA
jgi:adenylosuccinate synthase